MGFSTNERAERLMGRRVTPEEEERGVVAFDQPCELGYWCPVHKIRWDERLLWSEYSGFLWCAECNRDYPSALCIPMTKGRGWRKHGDWFKNGPEDAIECYLSTVEQAVRKATSSSS